MGDKTLGITTEMDVDNISDGLTEIADQLGELPQSQDIDINLTGDALDQVKNLKESLEDLSGESASPDANLGGNAQDDVDNLESDLTDLDNETATPEANLGGDAEDSVDNLKSDMDDLDSEEATPEADLEGDALDKTDELKEDLEDLDNTTVTPEVDSDSIDETTSSSNDAITAVAGVTSAIAAVDEEAIRMGSERSLEKALSYEGLPATTANVNSLRSALSQVQGAIPTEEASEGVYILSKGLQDASKVSAELAPAFTLVKTTGMDTSTAMYDLSSIITHYNLNSDDAVSTTEYLNEAILDMNSSAGDSATILSTVVSLMPSLSSLGYSAEDIVNYLGAFGDAGINASTAASALTTGAKTLSKQLTTSSYDSSNAKEALDAMGISAYDANGNFRSTSDIMDDVIDKTTSMTDAQFQAAYGISKYQALYDIFGNRAALIMQNLGESADDYGNKVQENGDKTTDTMSTINSNTMSLTTVLQKLKNQLEETQLPNWMWQGAAIATGFVVLVKTLQIFGGALKAVWDWGVKVKDVLGDLKDKINGINSDGENPLEKWDEKVFGDKTLKETVQTKFEIVSDEAGELKTEGDVTSFVEKTKTKLGELKESNVWKMLFGDEKGSLNFSVLDQAEAKIGSFVDKTKTKLSELKGAISSGLDEGYEHYYGGSESASESSESLDKITGKVKESINKVDGFLDEGYDYYYGTSNNVENTSSETLDKITEDVEGAKDKISEILDEGYEHYYGKTGSFLDDEEGAIRGFNLDDLVNKVSSAKNRINEILDEGYEHYYGNNDKAVESNSETLDKITSKFESTKDKIGEILDEGYEHYYGDSKSFLDDEEGAIRGLDFSGASSRISSFVDNAKAKFAELKETQAEISRWGSLMSDADSAGRDYSYLNQNLKVTEHPYLNAISGAEDEDMSRTIKVVADKTTLIKDVMADFGRDYGNIIDTSARIINGSYEGLERTCKVHLDNIKYSDELTSIEEEMKVFRERYKEQLKGVEEDTTSFLDDEEGRIQGVNLDDLVNKVSSAKEKITGILDDGYEHYYGNNNKAVESNSETLDKITEKFESTKNKVNEILDEGYEHYYGDNNKIESSSSETLNKLTSKVETTKEKVNKILDDGYEHYYGDTKSFLDDEEGRVNTSLSDISSRISSFIGDTKAKLGELKESDVWSKIFGDGKGSVTTAEGKLSGFIDDVKVKVGELDGYDVFDRIFKDSGQGNAAYNKISNLVNSIESKVGELDKFNVIDKVTGRGVTGKIPVETGGTGETRTPITGESNGIIDMVKGAEGYVPNWEGQIDSVSRLATITDKVSTGAMVATQLYYDLYHASDLYTEPINKAWGEMSGGNPLETIFPVGSIVGGSVSDYITSKLGIKPMSAYDEVASIFGKPKADDIQKYLHDNVSGPVVEGWKEFTKNPLGYLGSSASELGSNLSGLLGNIKLPSLSSIESGIGSELNGLKSYITSHIPKMPNILGDLSKIKLPSLSSIESGIGSEFNSLKTYVTSHLPKVPTINWNTLGNGLGGVVTKAENTYNGLKSYVLSHVPKIPIPTWSNVSQGLNGIVSTAESEYGGLKSYVISHIPKVPIPSWGNIRSGLPGAVKTAEDDLRGLESFVGGVPGKLYSLGNQIGERFAAGIRSAEGDVNSALQWLKDRLPASPPKTGPLAGIKAENMQSWASGIAHAGVSGFSEIESGISSTLGSAVNTAESELSKIEGTVTGFSGEMESTASYLWNIGESMVANLSSGLSAGLPDLSSVFTRISNMFPHSPPKEGPLASIKAENMKAWTKNIAQAGVEGLSRFTGYMDEMVQVPNLPNLTSPNLAKSVNGSQAGQTVINLTVAEGAVVIKGNATEETVKNAGTIFGESAAEKLARQANNSGYSTINVIR